MTFLNAKKVVVVGIFVVGVCNAVAHASTQSTTTRGEQLPGKKLICREVGLLNVGLAIRPVAVVRMKLAYDATLEAIKAIQSCVRCDKKFIEEQIKSILDPVRLFFKEIHTYASTVIPLVEESLLSKRGSPVEQAQERATCYILNFFESKDDLDVFFNKHVNTKEELIKVCTEFSTFFEDLRLNFSEEVKQAELAILKKLEDNKKAIYYAQTCRKVGFLLQNLQDGLIKPSCFTEKA